MRHQSDTALLVPAFWERLEPALRELRGQGFHPVVHETLRSLARSEALVAAGKSKSVGPSMHCYGLAADVVCGVHGYDCKRHCCPFFNEYGIAVERHRLTWGGRWKTLVDSPHCQAIPVALQNKARAMPADQLDAFVRSVLG